jgi:predicted aspartyl protease
MGTFRTTCRAENPVERSKGVQLPLLVDTGSEYTWIPGAKLEKIGVAREKKDLQFVMANGTLITRSVGFAILRVDKSFTIDEVVFAEPGDLALLGAHSLEGLNLTVDSARKKLVAAGPLPVA